MGPQISSSFIILGMSFERYIIVCFASQAKKPSSQASSHRHLHLDNDTFAFFLEPIDMGFLQCRILPLQGSPQHTFRKLLAVFGKYLQPCDDFFSDSASLLHPVRHEGNASWHAWIQRWFYLYPLVSTSGAPDFVCPSVRHICFLLCKNSFDSKSWSKPRGQIAEEQTHLGVLLSVAMLVHSKRPLFHLRVTWGVDLNNTLVLSPWTGSFHGRTTYCFCGNFNLLNCFVSWENVRPPRQNSKKLFRKDFQKRLVFWHTSWLR